MRVLRLLLAASCLAAPAFAAPDESADGDPASIIVTGARDRGHLPDMSGTLIFAGKLADVSLLTDRPPVADRNLRLALAGIPGLLVSEVSNGSWASLSYRGLGEPHESWNILTLADAVPAVPDMYSYPAGYFTPPLELIERVEFIRGGAGLLYGPQPGGALNYVTRGPLRQAGANALLRGGYGSFDSATGLLSGQVSNGRFGADGYLHHARSDGPRRANSDSEQTSAQARAYLTSNTLTLVAAFDWYEGRFGDPGGLSAARYQADRRDVSLTRDRLFIRRAAPSVSLDWQAGDATQVTARLWTSHYERTSWRQAGGGFGQATPDANVLIRQTQTFRTYAADLRVRRDFGDDDSVTLGVLAHGSDAPVAVDKGATNADVAGTAGALTRATRSGDAVAAFGELRLALGDVQLVPGFRVERLRQRVTETLDLAVGNVTGGPPGAPNGALSARRDVQWVPLWGVGATWDATPEVRFVANASRGFKPKLYNDGVTFQAGVDAAGEFDASYATTLEAGVQAHPAAAVRVNASLFRVTFDDQVGFLAGPLPASPPFGAVGAGGARRQTVGSMRNQGLDLSASVDLLGPAGLSPAPGTLRAGATLQLLDATFTDGPARGNRPQYAPRRIARGTLQWIGADGGRAAFALTSVGRQNGSDNGAPEFDIPAFTVADLTAELPLGDTFSLGAGVTNLFDERYISRIRPGGGGGIDPGRPRAAYVSLTARL